MPQDRQAVMQFAIILLALPVQYLIVTYFGSTATQKNHQLQQLISLATKYKDEYLSWETWQKWCYDVFKRVASFNIKDRHTKASESGADDGESLAVEVLRYRNPKGYFGMSVEPRSPRPSFVRYRVGQVIRHKLYNYRGVIVGWDPVGKAPDNWLEKNVNSNKKWKNQPNYQILVDTRDRLTAQTAYVAEEFIEILQSVKIIHPELDRYFEVFDGIQYLPRPRLKVLYPHD